MSEAVTPNRLEEVVARAIHNNEVINVWDEPGQDWDCTLILSNTRALLAALRAALEADPELAVELGAAHVGDVRIYAPFSSDQPYSSVEFFPLHLLDDEEPVFAWPARDDTEEKK